LWLRTWSRRRDAPKRSVGRVAEGDREATRKRLRGVEPRQVPVFEAKDALRRFGAIVPSAAD